MVDSSNPIEFKPEKGVILSRPPEEFIPRITESINNIVANIPPDAHGGIFAIADGSGANLAFVIKGKGGPLNYKIVTYAGSKWHGSLDYGVELIGTF